MSIIQNLIDEGALVLYHNYRAGHLKDLSGQGNDGVGTDVDWLGSGVGLNGATSLITVADAAELQGDEFALVVYGDFMSQGAEVMLSKRDGGGLQYYWYLNGAGAVDIYDGADARTLAVDVTGHRYVAINFKNGETPEGFLDGASAGNYSGTVAISANDADLTIGARYDNSYVLKVPVYAVLIVNRKLLDAEHAALYAELESLQFPTSVSSIGLGSYGPELVTDGDMETAGTGAWSTSGGPTLSKESGRAMAGDQVLRITKDAPATDAAVQVIMTSGTTYHITGWARGDATANPRVGGSAYFWTGTTSTAWQRFDFVATWDHTMVFLYANGGAATNWVEFDNVSVREVLADEVQFKTDWGVHAGNTNFTAGYVENSPFLISSGTWKVTTDTVNGKTAKVLECVAAGKAYLLTSEMNISPSLAARGTFDFYLQQASTGITWPTIAFISDGVGITNGYFLYVDPTPQTLVFYRANPAGSLFASGNDLIVAGTWHRIRVTVSDSGAFTTYVDGTEVAEASGSNPVTDTNYTTSTMMVLDLDAGDKISLGSVDGDCSLWKGHGVIAP